jgi:phosphoadenylyl-sulfate reductase (thioredoxin)
MSGSRDGSEEFERLEKGTPEELLQWCSNRFGPRASLASSYSVEDMVLMDMISRVARSLTIFTVDTGRLPEETHRLMGRAKERYGVPVKVLSPDTTRVERMISNNGPDLFYRSVDLRMMCCHIRKVEPLLRALEGLDAWIVGSRREDIATGGKVRKLNVDEEHENILMISPLADWTNEMVWDYVKKHNVPYNELHDKGYSTIGCAPCCRAIPPGEDPGSAQWWWEKDAKHVSVRPR